MQTSDHFDSIIVGAGHNGLVCAAYLARRGQRVLVLEASDAPGGLGKKNMQEFLRIVSLPAHDSMDECFNNDILKATLSWDGLIGSKLAPRPPNGAVLAMLYRMSEETRGAH